jgi:hypothetical protein
MIRWPSMIPVPKQPDPNQRRQTGRIAPEGVTCNLGKVLDLSAGGLRLTGRGARPGALGDKIVLSLDWGLGSLDFEGVITRFEKRPFFGWVAGIRFENLTPQRRQALSKASMLAASGEITEWTRAS